MHGLAGCRELNPHEVDLPLTPRRKCRQYLSLVGDIVFHGEEDLRETIESETRHSCFICEVDALTKG